LKFKVHLVWLNQKIFGHRHFISPKSLTIEIDARLHIMALSRFPCIVIAVVVLVDEVVVVEILRFSFYHFYSIRNKFVFKCVVESFVTKFFGILSNILNLWIAKLLLIFFGGGCVWPLRLKKIQYWFFW